MLVITIDEKKNQVHRNFEKPSDVKKFLHNRKLSIKPKGVQVVKGVYYKAYTVHSYLKDTTPRFHTLLMNI